MDADKRLRVAMALAEAQRAGTAVSDREIARRCKVSQPFVSRLRKQLTAPQEVPVHGDNELDAPDPEPLEAPLDAFGDNGANAIEASHLAGDQAAPGPDHDGTSRIVNDVPFFAPDAGPDAVHDGDLEATSAVAPDEPPADKSTLVSDVYADAERALTRRLAHLQAEHGRIVEGVARGELDSGEIAASRGRLRTTREELEDLVALQEHAARVKAERAAAQKVQRYHQVVTATEGALVQALETAQAIDRALEALGEVVGTYRGQVEACNDLTRSALNAGGRPLLDAVNVWASQRMALDADIMTRLLALGVLTNRAVVPTAQPQPIAVAVKSWTTKLIATARERGPVLLEDEDHAGDDA